MVAIKTILEVTSSKNVGDHRLYTILNTIFSPKNIPKGPQVNFFNFSFRKRQDGQMGPRWIQFR